MTVSSFPHGTMGAAIAGATVDLSAMLSSYDDESGITTTYGVSFVFGTDGFLDILRERGSDNLNVVTFSDPASAVSGLSVRCVHNSGVDMNAGVATGVWHALTSARTFQLTYTSSGGFDQISGNFDFELSDDGGSTVIANKAGVVVTVGEIF